MHKPYNPNPHGNRVDDCVPRALCKATGEDWETVMIRLAIEAVVWGDMPNANHVWGNFLKRHGFRRTALPDDCPGCYTVRDFCRDHPHGMYILATGTHVVCVENGDYYDTWDSGDAVPAYYWQKERE